MIKHVIVSALAGTCIVTALPVVDHALYSANPRNVSIAHRVGTSPVGQDTLVSNVTWRIVGDGRGDVDSIKVNFVALVGGWVTAKLPSNAVSVEFRQPIPIGDATYNVHAQVCSYRRDKSSCATSSTSVITVVDTPPPTPDGVAFTTTVIRTP